MNDGGNRVVVYGEVLVDLFSGPPARPGKGMREFAYHGLPGGAPCNVAVHLARLGVPVSFAASFADDSIGLELRSLLQERGIDLSRAAVHPGSRSPVAMVTSLPGGDRSFRLYLTGTVAELAVPGEPRAILQDARWFHCGSVVLPFSGPKDQTLQLLQAARERGIVTSFDLNIRPDVWPLGQVPPSVLSEVLPYVDVLKFSDEDLQWLRQNVLPSLEGPEALFDFGCQLLAHTHGAEGATLIARQTGESRATRATREAAATPETREAAATRLLGESLPVRATPLPKEIRAQRLSVSAPQVAVVDTTGAGDAFMAGLIAGLLRAARLDGLALEAAGALQAAGALAARCAGDILVQRGAMPPAE